MHQIRSWQNSSNHNIPILIICDDSVQNIHNLAWERNFTFASASFFIILIVNKYAWNTNFSLHNCFDIFFRFIRQIISMQIWFEIIHILFSWMQQTTLFEWNLQLNSFCVLEWVVFNDKNLSSTILSLVKHTNQWIHSALFKL